MATGGIWPVLLLICCIQVCQGAVSTSSLCTKSCENGGYCTWSGNTTYCACPDQYYGDTCELMCNMTKCAGGRCIMYMSSSTCLCPGGYIEPMCTTNCTDTFCQNNGTCSIDVDGMLMCYCMDGFTGSRCEVNNTSIVSCSGTNCTGVLTKHCTLVEAGVTCHCRADFTGTHCERRNCLNVDVNNCSSTGTCNFNDFPGAVNECSCMPGYTGSKCDSNIDDCVGVTCENGGTCIDGIASFNCSCPSLYTGDYCEKADCVARGCANLTGNGMCDTECMFMECNYDGLECSLGVNPWFDCKVMPSTRGRHCSVLFMDGVCDPECNTNGCLYDGFDCVNNGTMLADCFNTSHCFESIGNNVCDVECNNLECAYDGQDCASTSTTNQKTLVLTFTPMNASFGRLAEARLVAFQLSQKLRSRVYIRQNNGSDNMVYRIDNSSDSNIRAYYDIEQPSNCTVAGSCVTDVQTAAKMVAAVVWMYERSPKTRLTIFKSVTTCTEGYQYSNGNCNSTCNIGCQSTCNFETGSCVNCMDSYVGNTCDVKCSSNCARTCNATQCIGGCQRGYIGDKCDQACSTGTYGTNCSMTCSDCANDNCTNTDGTCKQGCKNKGRKGTQCTENCASGNYGENCGMSCSTNCLNKKCDRVTGNCTGLCPTNKWGNTCNEDCSSKTCTTKCDACTPTTAATTASTASASANSDVGIIAVIIILVILIIVAVIISYCLWRRSQAGVYDLDEKKGDELPLNAAHVESGQSDDLGTPMVAMATGNGSHEVEVVSETTIRTTDKNGETKPLIENEINTEQESERKEPDGRENSAEPDDTEEPMRESREMKTASKYMPPTEQEGGPGGVYVGPTSPAVDDVQTEQESQDTQQESQDTQEDLEDTSFSVTPAELVAPPSIQQDTGTDLQTPPSPSPDPDTPPSPPPDMTAS
ncbi:fibropellin-1-like [Mizuhopecten yessoensis]|uniref:fibropellin-1-like n=1 Tax=Mizuhopecten yessoensis TaxID=6573 RepID=UPI000B45F43A|nr:fibropellin-1-like [Mizuhopecten yessoensis]